MVTIIEPFHQVRIEWFRLICDLIYVVYICMTQSNILNTKNIFWTLIWSKFCQSLIFIELHFFSINVYSRLILIIRFTDIIRSYFILRNKITAYIICLFRTFLFSWELFLLLENLIIGFDIEKFFFLSQFEILINSLVFNFLTLNFWFFLTTLMLMSFSSIIFFPAQIIFFLVWPHLMSYKIFLFNFSMVFG